MKDNYQKRREIEKKLVHYLYRVFDNIDERLIIKRQQQITLPNVSEARPQLNKGAPLVSFNIS